MSDSDTPPPGAPGGATFVVENIRAARAGAPAGDTLEYPLFTDADVVGDLTAGMGPYELLNAVPARAADPRIPTLFIRATYHVVWMPGDMARTDDARYHGGTDSDEIAALVSLLLGIRLKAGPATRYFQKDRDPRGQPVAFTHYGQENPILLTSAHGAVLPRAAGEHRLEATPLLTRLHELGATESIALTRAARLYQDALWVAESQPELAWLLLVSAVETAAGAWHVGTDTAEERLREFKPDLYDALLLAGGAAHVSDVAAILGDTIGATRKFRDFLLRFLPAAPPTPRPQHPLSLVAWERDAVRRALNRIYKCRSLALHAGTPFPGPMCMPPRPEGDSFEERPFGPAVGIRGSVWRAADTPMFLHTFEHIARQALLDWWGTLFPAQEAD